MGPRYIAHRPCPGIRGQDHLRHRLDDDADWWCYPESEQLKELNSGNAAFIDVGRDGQHVGTLQEEPLQEWQFELWLKCPSGKVFIGAGEEATSDGMEPECDRGGLMLQVPAGAVHLRISSAEPGQIEISVCPVNEPSANAFTEPLRLRPLA